MSRQIRVAAVQLHAHDRTDLGKSLPAILDRLEAAAAQAQLVVLPEATLPAYVLGDDAIDDTAVAAGLDAMRAIAARTACVIVVGAAVRHNGRLSNEAVVIDADGSLAGAAGKIFLWHFDRKWFAPGTTLAPVHTAIGSIGALVCADGRIPTIAQTLVDRGAELLVMPTAWVTSGRDPQALENVQADLLARVRAYENHVPFIAANKCGVEGGMVAYCGKSQIIDADGALLELASQTSSQTISTQITVDGPRTPRATLAPIAARSRADDATIRLAISIDPLPPDIDARLRLLDAQIALAPGVAIDALDALVPTVALDASAVHDSRLLAAYRLAGYRVAVLDAKTPSPWTLTIARARALELRMYVIVLDRALERAYAIDPDGVVIAGTYPGYRLSSFPIDVRRTSQTLVAPGTDVAEGLERVHALSEREDHLP